MFVSIVIRKFTNIMLAIQSRKYLIGESSNINEVIRSILNFLFFFHDKISSTKKYKNASSVFIKCRLKVDLVLFTYV